MGKIATSTRWNREKKVMEKRCSACHQWMDANTDNFCRSKQTCDGLYHQCKPCKAISAAKWREKNPDYNKAWKAENPDKVKRANANYRENHRIELRLASRLYHAREREETRMQRTMAYVEHPEIYRQRAKEWATNNPERRKRAKQIYHEETKWITPEVRAAAGEWYRRDARLPDGTIVRVIGRMNDLWVVRLHDPIKIGKDQFQRIVRVRQIEAVA